jgi:hypothetical protein
MLGQTKTGVESWVAIAVVHAALSWCVLCLTSGEAAAQARAIDAQRFTPAADTAGFLGLEATRTPGPFQLSLSLFTDLAFDPVEIDAGAGDLVAVEQQLGAQLAAELGLGGRAAVVLRLPAVLHQQGERVPGLAGDTLDSFAVGDPRIAARYRFVGGSTAKRDAPVDGPGLALQASSTVPVGNDDAFVGEGRVRAQLELLGDFQLLGAGIGGSVGFRHSFEGNALPAREELTFAAALKMPLPFMPSLVAVLETRGAADFESEKGTQLELDLAVKAALSKAFTLVAGGGVGLSDGIGTPDGRLILGLYFVPPHGDSDGDGISDDEDECKQLAEDDDGFDDHDGCPDPDNDNDLVPDVDDLCPLDAAEEGRDEDEDGCTDPAAPTTSQAP